VKPTVVFIEAFPKYLALNFYSPKISASADVLCQNWELLEMDAARHPARGFHHILVIRILYPVLCQRMILSKAPTYFGI
jgi:hypothetical protein